MRHGARWPAWLAGCCLGAAVCGPCLAATDTSAATSAATGAGDNGAAQPAEWRSRQIDFHFVSAGANVLYTCSGMAGKVEELLALLGAGSDSTVTPVGCAQGVNAADRLATVRLKISTLQPAAAGTTQGLWRPVSIAPYRPADFGYEDCELVRQFRDRVLPLFVVREPKSQFSCVPFDAGASSWSLSAQVLAPRSPREHP